MDNKICRNCGTENDAEYDFCKNCGNALFQAQAPAETVAAESTEPQQSYVIPPTPPTPPVYQPSQQTQQQYQQYNQYQQYQQSPPQQNAAPEIDSIDGVSVEDVRTFVGPNSNKFIKKFVKMERTGKKVSCNLVVLLLGIFLGPIASACWFFHRKMNKIGALYAVVGTLIWSASVYFSYNFLKDFFVFFTENFDKITSSIYPPKITEDLLISYLFYMVLSFVSMGISLALAIVGGLLANNWYKNFVCNSVKSIQTEDSVIRGFELSQKGGTSCVLWVAIIIVWVVAYFAVSALLLSTAMPFFEKLISYQNSFYFNKTL